MNFTIKKIRNYLLRSGFGKKSYSQCGEDLIIDYFLRSIESTEISWIDIGAHHPKYLNNTYFFYKMGFRGINIDANPYAISKFKFLRRGDVNLNYGLGMEDERRKLYVMSDPALSCFGIEEVNNALKVNSRLTVKKELLINCITLSTLIENLNIKKFPSFLNLDVEGMDEIIVEQLTQYTHDKLPQVICCETINYERFKNQIKDMELINKIEKIGYKVYADTWLNTILIKNA